MNETNLPRPVILLVDDDPHDVVLIRLAFRKIGIIDTIQLVKNGTEAMWYIKGEGIYSNRNQFPPPTLMLLDLKMPQTSGFEVLEWVRKDASLDQLVVVVMSSSRQEHDVQRAYALGANLYLVKPSKFSELVKMMDSLRNNARLPSGHPAAPATINDLGKPEPIPTAIEFRNPA
jgi:CheY-like chemotaxis protein